MENVEIGFIAYRNKRAKIISKKPLKANETTCLISAQKSMLEKFCKEFLQYIQKNA